ncbi:MAG: choice-of-anchor J domain-containing protein [Rikenellaceae bacterium]
MKKLFLTSITLCAAISASVAQTYFTPQFSSTSPETIVTKSGIDNMERISYAGEIFATGKQAKNGWGKSSSGDSIDFLGTNLQGLPDDYTNQNNDWLISPEIDLTAAKSPVVEFSMLYNYGVDNTNTLSIFVCTSGYVSAAAPEGNNVKAMPEGEWVSLDKSIYGDTANQPQKFSYSLAPYVGQKIRIAFRATNRLKQNINNSRMYRISDLVIKER